MRRSRLIALAMVVALGAASPAWSEPASADSRRIQRLEKLARVWGQIRFTHPYLASRIIDWDGALIAALPAAEAASDSASYARVLDAMLSRLGDPATRVARGTVTTEPLPPSPRPLLSAERGVLVITLTSAAQPGFLSPAERGALADAIGKAKAAVVDLRARPGGGSWVGFATGSWLERWLPLFVEGELRVPGSRSVYYAGYPSPEPLGPGGYVMGFTTAGGSILAGTPGPKPRRVAFLLDEVSPLPAALFALKQRGAAILVGEGFPHDHWVVVTSSLDAGDGIVVETRLEELGTDERVDVRVPSRAPGELRDTALERALELLRKPPRARRPPVASPAEPLWRPDPLYADEPFPDRAHRQLAAIRLWTVIRLFYPYLDLLEGAWEGALARFLPRFESAVDAREYGAAAMEMAALIRDGHTYVVGPAVEEVLGKRTYPPFDVLEIEGLPVVVEVPDSTLAPGVDPGDVIEAVDGVPMEERLRRVAPYVTGGTPAGTRLNLIRQALSGTDTTFTLRLSGRRGTRVVPLTRTRAALARARAAGGPSYRVLPGDVGYVAMKRLQQAEVKTMFEELGRTRAMVFDMRGYPNGTAWTITPYLNTRGEGIAARYRTSFLSGSRLHPEDGLAMDYRLRREGVPIYRGRTFMLIDERAISQAEHTGLLFEAANGTTFVGSPTAGSNGGITRLPLPGGLFVTFTGNDIRHGDGRQLQRVGIQPDLPVRPTIAGLRAGRDEVLERALRAIEEVPAARNE